MASRIRIHSPVGKSHVPIIHSSLVAKKQKQQPTNAPKLDFPDPKFNFDLSKIPISSPHRSSQPSPKINPKLGDNKSGEKERETESKNSETTIQTFTPSPPGQPQEADKTKKQLQQPEVRAKSESQQSRADVLAKIKTLSRYNFDLTKIPISAPNRPPVQSKLNFDLSSPDRVQQPIDGKRKRSLAEESKNSASAPPLIPIARSDFADGVSRNERSLQEYSDQFPYSPKVARKPLISNPWQRTVMFSTVQRDRLSTKEDNSQELTAPSTTSSDLESSIQQTQGGGQPLEDKVREPMEQAFGADFSGVRIHTDRSAVGMNQELGAQAFTHGNDIYFDDGKYNPQSSEGQHLLAHELTHTVQQGASIQRLVNISTGLTPKLQLWGWSSLKERAIRKLKGGLNSLAEYTIPGYSLLNVVLGKNLITGDKVARSGVNLIKGYMGLSPLFGEILFRELQETKTLPQAGKWVEGKVAKFGINFNDISRRLKLFWNEVSGWKGIEGNLKVFKKHLGPVIGKIMAFSSVVMEKVKELRFEGALRLVGATELLNALKQDPKAFKKAVDNPKDVLKQFMVGALKKGFA
ncbi:MAG: DUF4157 domain-containing protein, partial [Pleurocapsa sp. MO_226.B13]|nr:DUF4157 domain-containing protein [Pleurocapsa sp. MO_226.B13]